MIPPSSLLVRRYSKRSKECSVPVLFRIMIMFLSPQLCNCGVEEFLVYPVCVFLVLGRPRHVNKTALHIQN